MHVMCVPLAYMFAPPMWNTDTRVVRPSRALRSDRPFPGCLLFCATLECFFLSIVYCLQCPSSSANYTSDYRSLRMHAGVHVFLSMIDERHSRRCRGPTLSPQLFEKRPLRGSALLDDGRFIDATGDGSQVLHDPLALGVVDGRRR